MCVTCSLFCQMFCPPIFGTNKNILNIQFNFALATISGQANAYPIYVASFKGTPILTYNGYKFAKTGKTILLEPSKLLKTRWRCAFFEKRRYRCTAKALTFKNADAIEIVEFLGTHCHARPI